MNKNEANALLISLASKYLSTLIPKEVYEQFGDYIAEANKLVDESSVLKNWSDKTHIVEHWDGVISEVRMDIDNSFLDTLKSALFNNQQIDLQYKNNPSGIFNIFGLITRDKQIYLIGSYGQSLKPYLLSLNNIYKIKQLTSPIVSQPENLNIREFTETHLNFFKADNNIEELIIEFPQSVYAYIKSNPLHAKEIELTESNTAPGFFRLIAKQVNNNQLFQQWLLGFNNKAQVIEPLELRQIINHSDLDKLTNLYNRNVFERLLNREIDWCHRDSSHYFSLLIMDIDHFKHVNDSYGHVFGDEVLKEFANCLRDYDGIRYGGEEFIVFLPQTDAKNSYQIAERIRNKLENLELNYNDQLVKITISIGIAQFPLHLTPDSINCFKDASKQYLSDKDRSDYLKEITKQADQALYQAKGQGRNQTLIVKHKNKDKDLLDEHKNTCK